MSGTFYQDFDRHGYVNQCTDIAGVSSLDPAAGAGVYIGFDATASSLHVGSLVQIMMLKRLQLAGFTPVVLFGGGTTLVGDPSQRSKERNMMSPDKVAENIDGLKSIFLRYLDDSGSNAVKYVNNADWLQSLNYVDFLRQVGQHFSVNRMVSFESVKLRLASTSGLSFLEFNYMIMQAYDFYILARDHDVVIQCGGSDQWGNIVCGIDLTRRLLSKTVYGITSPLVTMASGVKMGKTEAGAVWLNGDLLPDFDFWQYWRNIDDRDVGRFLRLFTLLPEDEIKSLEQLEDSKINQAKARLADEVTSMARGSEAAAKAAAAARQVFAGSGLTDDLPYVQIDMAADDGAGGGAQSAGSGLELLVLELFLRSGLVASRSEARRLISAGGASLDGERVADIDQRVSLLSGKRYKLSLGKKRHILVGVDKDASKDAAGEDVAG